jgi:hypothetical protein
MQAINHLDTVNEFASIIRGEHPAYRGDRRENAGFFLRQIRNDMPEQAKQLAFDIECNLNDYIKATGLPERTLVQAQKVLYGIWSGL